MSGNNIQPLNNAQLRALLNNKNKLNDIRFKIGAVIRASRELKGNPVYYRGNGPNQTSYISSDNFDTWFRVLLALLARDQTEVPKVAKVAKVAKRGDDGPIKISELRALINILADSADNKNVFLQKAQSFLKFSEDIGAVNFREAPVNHQNIATQIYEEITKPKIMVFLNPVGVNEVRPVLNVSKGTEVNNQIRSLADSDNYINIVKPAMDFRKFKDANKTSVVMSIGSSGAGKSFLLNMLDKSGMYGKRVETRFYAPSIKFTRSPGKNKNIKNQVISIEFTSVSEPINATNFDKTYIKPSPFNPASSRAHKLMKYENGDIIVDLCGTESAVDISINALGFNLFNENIFTLKASGMSLLISDGMQELGVNPKVGFAAITVTGPRAYTAFAQAFKIGRGIHPQYDIGTLDGPDDLTIRIKHAIACGIVKKWTAVHKSKTKTDMKVSEVTSTHIINSLEPEYRKRLFDENAYKNPVAGTYYAFQILSRCLEGMWISRTLDELALIYNAVERITYFKGEGARGWKTTDAYSVPSGMKYDNGKYSVEAANLMAGNSDKPFALGNSSGVLTTPISPMIATVEPKFKKNKLNAGEKADTTVNLHRMVVLLKVEYNKNKTQKPLGSIHQSVLKRIGGWAKLKKVEAAKSTNNKRFNASMQRYFENGSKLGIGFRHQKLGRAFNPNEKGQTFPGSSQQNTKNVFNSKVDRIIKAIETKLSPTAAGLDNSTKQERLKHLIRAPFEKVLEKTTNGIVLRRNNNEERIDGHKRIKEAAMGVLLQYNTKNGDDQLINEILAVEKGSNNSATNQLPAEYMEQIITSGAQRLKDEQRRDNIIAKARAILARSRDMNIKPRVRTAPSGINGR